MFDVTGSVYAFFIRFGPRILIRTLKNDARSAARMLDAVAVCAIQEEFKARHPDLKDVHCVSDGLS